MKKKLVYLTVLVLLFAGVGAAAFTVLDSYEDGDISEYSGDTGSYSVSSSHAYDGSNSLEMIYDSNPHRIDTTQKGDLSSGNTYWFWLRSENSDHRQSFEFANDAGGGSFPGYAVEFDGNQGGLVLWKDGTGSTQLDFDSYTFSPPEESLIEIKWYSNGTIHVNAWDTSLTTKKASVSADDSSYSSGDFGWYQNCGSCSSNSISYADYVGEGNISVNDAPTIDSNTTRPSPSTITGGDSVDTVVNATDPDGDPLSAWVTVNEDGTDIVTDKSMSQPSTGDFQDLDTFTADEINVWYNITYTVGDGTANSTSEIKIFNEDNPPTLSFNPSTPTDGTVTSDTFALLNVSASDDLGLSLVRETFDGTNSTFADVQNSGGNWWENHTGLSEGTHTLRAWANDTADQFTFTSERTVTVDTTSPDLNIFEPDGNFSSKDFILFNYTASDANNLDKAVFSVDGGANTTVNAPANTTFNVSDVGYHVLDAWVNDTAGNIQHENTTFFADHLNEIRLDDEDTGDSIQDFDVTYDNGTETFTVSPNDGTANFNTTDLPTGENELILKASGYDTKKGPNQTVSASYEINKSFDMTPAGVTFSVQNEQTEKFIKFNATFKNDTEVFEMRAQEERTPGTGFGWVNGGSKSFTFGYEDNVISDNFSYSVSCDSTSDGGFTGSSVDIGYTSTGNVTFDMGGGSSGSVSIFENDTIETVKLDLSGSGSSDVTNCNLDEVFLTNTDHTIGLDFDRYLGIGFPKGDVTVTAESDGFSPRDYFVTVNNNTRLNLDAYLLEDGEGIQMGMETVDESFDPVADATLSVQREFGTAFKTVAQETTTTAGDASFFLDPDIQYKVIATHPDFKTAEETFSPSNYQFDTLTIQFASTSTFEVLTAWSSVSVKIEPDTQTLPAFGKVWVNGTISDSEGGLDRFNLTVRNSSHLLNDSEVTGSPSGGEIQMVVNLSEQEPGDLINASLSFTKDGKDFTYLREYDVGLSFEKGDQSLLKGMEDFRDSTGPIVTGFLALFLTLTVSAGFGSRLGREGAGLISLVVLGFFTLVNWINPFYWMIALLAVIGVYGLRR